MDETEFLECFQARLRAKLWDEGYDSDQINEIIRTEIEVLEPVDYGTDPAWLADDVAIDYVVAAEA